MEQVSNFIENDLDKLEVLVRTRCFEENIPTVIHEINKDEILFKVRIYPYPQAFYYPGSSLYDVNEDYVYLSFVFYKIKGMQNIIDFFSGKPAKLLVKGTNYRWIKSLVKNLPRMTIFPKKSNLHNIKLKDCLYELNFSKSKFLIWTSLIKITDKELLFSVPYYEDNNNLFYPSDEKQEAEYSNKLFFSVSGVENLIDLLSGKPAMIKLSGNDTKYSKLKELKASLKTMTISLKEL